MGRTYSINGYINAALRRSGRTILVEGPSDKSLLHRLIAERIPSFNSASSIDHAGMIDDPLLSGAGNKVKVLNIQNSANILATSQNKINSKLGTLTDREWDGVNLESYAPSPQWTPPTQSENNFITLGHSIENYNFDIELIKDYLKYHFPEFINNEILSALTVNFHSILVLASVLSLKLKDEGQLSRSEGLIDVNHLNLFNDRLYLNDTFSLACSTRQISCAPTIVQHVNTGIDLAWNKLHTCQSTKWLPHGHIGSDVLWVGAAYISQTAGFPNNLVSEFAKGGKRQRELFQANWLSKEPSVKREPLDATLDWLAQA